MENIADKIQKILKIEFSIDTYYLIYNYLYCFRKYK